MATRKIGVLWKKNNGKGDYFTGMLDAGMLGKFNIGVFQNDKKDPDGKEPDANIVLFEEDKQ
jgi:hypothetical protein